MKAKNSTGSARYEKRSTDFYFRSDGGGRVPLNCRPHLHYHIEFFYLLEGSASVWVDSAEYTVGAGDLLIAFPNQLRQYRDCGTAPVRCLLFIVSPDLVPEFAGLFNSTLPHSPVVRGVGGMPRLVSLIEGLASFSRGGEKAKFSDEVQKGYIAAIFGQLLPLMTLDEIKMGDSRAVREVVNYCSQNYTADLSLEMLERELHLNKYYISHLFSSKLGIRFNDYVNSLRVSHACRLLRDTALPVTEISDAVGFNTQRTFNRAFARHRGCSPGEYRRALPERVENASFPPVGATPARVRRADEK